MTGIIQITKKPRLWRHSPTVPWACAMLVEYRKWLFNKSTIVSGFGSTPQAAYADMVGKASLITD